MKSSRNGHADELYQGLPRVAVTLKAVENQGVENGETVFKIGAHLGLALDLVPIERAGQFRLAEVGKHHRHRGRRTAPGHHDGLETVASIAAGAMPSEFCKKNYRFARCRAKRLRLCRSCSRCLCG